MNMHEIGYVRHIRACNQWSPGNFRDFYVADQRVGRLKKNMWEALADWPELFRIDSRAVHLRVSPGDFASRTEALNRVTQGLVARGVISHAHGERYPVTVAGREQAYATIDRAAAPYFGLRAYGQHMNGFVRDREGLKLWIARRSADRKNFPDKLDNMVAGGLPQDLGLPENLRKECWEEASIPAELARLARPVGALTYCRETPVGLKPDTLYCYDLELPGDFEPVNTDGEVADFTLLPVEEVARIVRETDEFKLNCNLVIIDFLVRHGVLGPDHPEYLAITQELHERL
jgi:8-oxo-dGTP pyrophosphatase MutT (NUDIX family)